MLNIQVFYYFFQCGIVVIILAVIAILLWAFLPRGGGGKGDEGKGGGGDVVKTNILMNPSFEDDLYGTWDNKSFWIDRVAEDVVHGNFSLKAWNRL